MGQEKAKKIQFVYGLAFGIMSVALAFLLILQVCDIYFNGGANPYTVESIKEHFNQISVALFLWIAIGIAGFVLWKLFPIKEKGIKIDEGYTLSNLEKKLTKKAASESELYPQFAKYQWLRLVVKFVCGVCVGICIVFSFAYLFNEANFPNQDQNKEVATAALYLLPFVAVSFALCVGVSLYERGIIKKQISVAKQLIQQPLSDGVIVEKKQEKIQAFFESKTTVASLRLAIAIIGVVLLIYGLATGGTAGVLAKAITICRQCIGLG